MKEKRRLIFLIFKTPRMNILQLCVDIICHKLNMCGGLFKVLVYSHMEVKVPFHFVITRTFAIHNYIVELDGGYYFGCTRGNAQEKRGMPTPMHAPFYFIAFPMCTLDCQTSNQTLLKYMTEKLNWLEQSCFQLCFMIIGLNVVFSNIFFTMSLVLK